MNCTCGGKTQVTSTREHATGSPYRRRVCTACGEAFHTIEVLYENDAPRAAPKSGRAVKRVKSPAPPRKRQESPAIPAASPPVISAARHRIEDRQYEREHKDEFE